MTTLDKAAATVVPLHPLLAGRWSSQAFDPDHEVTGEQLAALLEAARWAPIASSTQPWAVYDAGQAVAQLSVQAQAEGLAVHQMGGFDRDRLTAVLAGSGVRPLVVVAIGLRDEPARLTEPFAQRETAARVRLPVGELLLPVRPQQAG